MLRQWWARRRLWKQFDRAGAYRRKARRFDRERRRLLRTIQQ